MLQTSKLCCERERRVLFEDLTFAVSPGEILRIEGSNGTGKTTLLRILCGLYQDYTGEVEWDLDDYPLFVGHRPGVKDLLSARENLRWLANLYQSEASESQIDGALHGTMSACADLKTSPVALCPKDNASGSTWQGCTCCKARHGYSMNRSVPSMWTVSTTCNRRCRGIWTAAA